MAFHIGIKARIPTHLNIGQFLCLNVISSEKALCLNRTAWLCSIFFHSPYHILYLVYPPSTQTRVDKSNIITSTVLLLTITIYLAVVLCSAYRITQQMVAFKREVKLHQKGGREEKIRVEKHGQSLLH